MDGEDMVCLHCDKRLKKTSWDGLKLHIDRIHPDCGLEKTFACNECGNNFIFKCSLRPGRHKCIRKTPKTWDIKNQILCDVCPLKELSTMNDVYAHRFVSFTYLTILSLSL